MERSRRTLSGCRKLGSPVALVVEWLMEPTWPSIDIPSIEIKHQVLSR